MVTPDTPSCSGHKATTVDRPLNRAINPLDLSLSRRNSSQTNPPIRLVPWCADGARRELPNTEWISAVTDLFAKSGPYLVAVLFLAVALMLVALKSKIAIALCIASFVLSVASAVFGIFIWSKVNPLGPNANTKYVITYKFLDNGNFLKLLDHVELSNDLPRAVAYSAPEWASNRAYLILISELPVSDQTTVMVFLYPKDSSSPVVFCRPPQTPQQIDIAPDATKTDLPESSRFSFRVMQNGQWKPLTCIRNAVS